MPPPLSGLRAVPRLPLALVLRASPAAAAIDRDARRTAQPHLRDPLPAPYGPLQLAAALRMRPLRSLAYWRLHDRGLAWRAAAVLLRALWRSDPTFEVRAHSIGPGLAIVHGTATILTGRLGEDCTVSQQTTIGYADVGEPPRIGDRVRVGAGALVLGPIVVGDDAVIGAGAIVVRDVPAGGIATSPAARVREGTTDRLGVRGGERDRA